MQLFYYPNSTENDTTIILGKEESNHIIKVNRKQEGDLINITNGKGCLFTTEISLASSSKCQLKIIKVTKQEPLNYKLHLAVAPTKMSERYEWFLEKATEIGIHQITPIICNQSERRIRPRPNRGRNSVRWRRSSSSPTPSRRRLPASVR